MRKLLNKVTSGILLIVIGILHTFVNFSADGFIEQFKAFSKTFFFKVYNGVNDFQPQTGLGFYETYAAFCFFFFGLLLITMGILIHSIEKEGKPLSHYFTVSYLIVVILGSYMVPPSGIAYLMLPHAIYMLVSNYIKARKLSGSIK